MLNYARGVRRTLTFIYPLDIDKRSARVVERPETNLAGALNVAANVRLSIANSLINHSGSPLGILTISSGVVAISSPLKEGYRAALEEADRLLYCAKNKGRNSVEGRLITCVSNPH
ncbi:MAG: diguanylate cyclase, partial [Cytophagaceae bacterium]